MDTVKVTVFTWLGPLNVPENSIYGYRVPTAPLQGAKWVDSDTGTITGGQNSDVQIKWGAGPAPGKATYQVNANYIWDFGVNVVKVLVENTEDAQGHDNTFTPGTPFAVKDNNHNPVGLHVWSGQGDPPPAARA